MYPYVITIILSICMTVSLICGAVLWMRRKEMADRSRLFLAVFCFYVVFKMALFLFGAIGNNLMEFSNVLLSPHLTIGGLLGITLFVCYPLEVMRPRRLCGHKLVLLFLPSLLALLLSTVLPFYELHAWTDLWHHITNLSVLLRLLCVGFVAVFSMMLLFIPYNWRKSSADFHWILYTTLIAQVLSLFFYIHAFSNLSMVNLLHVLWGTYAILHFTYYELCVRLQPPVEVNMAKMAKPVLPEMENSQPADADDYWARLCQVMDETEVWRNPDTTVDTVSRFIGTNRIYLARCIREHTGMTFNDYINKKRTAFMACQLRSNPQQDNKALYFEAGFRSRTSAYRNFVKFMGCSPTVFVASLSQ